MEIQEHIFEGVHSRGLGAPKATQCLDRGKVVEQVGQTFFDQEFEEALVLSLGYS